jgi:hypothetical protein
MSVRRATYLDSSAIVKLVTYDTRMADAARELGWSVVAPA